MNFLQLAQKVAQESGTIPGSGNPVTVVSQAGRLKRVVDWTNDAWADIQTKHPNWRWMSGEFEGSTIANEQRYDSAAMSITSRFADWIYGGDGGDNLFTVYDPAIGLNDQGYLSFRDWTDFRRLFMIGTPETGKPRYFTIDPANKITFYPVPDAAYTIGGLYQKSPQTLALDADTPEMPARFHEAVYWLGLVKLATFDEAGNQIGIWKKEANRAINQLETAQLPRIELAGALA